MAKITNINNRNKTIEKPYVYKNKTFGSFSCQYASFENEVRFENCIFNEDVVFGDESTDEAFCIIKTDLIFDGCVFLNKVKLDGLQCFGHVIFKGNCVFKYGDEEHFDYALSMSNAKVGIGISITDSNFNAGINLSAIHVDLVGCQFTNVKLNNPRSDINFSSSYFGKELSIKTSNIECFGIGFEAVSVNPTQGTIQLGGNSFIQYDGETRGIESGELSQKFFEEKLGVSLQVNQKVASLYIKETISKKVVLIVKEKCDIREFQHVINIFKAITKDDSHLACIPIIDEIDNTDLSPVGDIHFFSDQASQHYISIFYLEALYLVNSLDDNHVRKYNYEEFAPYIFNDIFKDNIVPLTFKYRFHRGVPMLYATSPLNDLYIAIFDQLQSFKRYKWNYIKCDNVLDLSQASVGRGLYIRQSEFDIIRLDIHALHAYHEIFFEDVIFNMHSLDASQVRVPIMRFNNIDFVYKDISCLMMNNPEDWMNCGINIDYSQITNKIEIKSITANQYEEFFIKANYIEVGNILKITDLQHGSQLKIQLMNSKIHQWVLNDINWKNILVETENIYFSGIEINGHKPEIGEIKKICSGKDKTIIGEETVSHKKQKVIKTSPIHFLKILDGIYEKYDLYESQRKLWKFRNRIRINRDYPKLAFVHIIINELLLNYGWSPWRIVYWLIAFISLFDILTWHYFGMDIYTSIVNGFVEFIPISFNEPIVEQLHGVNPQDPKYGPPLLSFGYSALVTIYRLLSYTLLSVLIAAFAGYFRKKNQ